MICWAIKKKLDANDNATGAAGNDQFYVCLNNFRKNQRN